MSTQPHAPPAAAAARSSRFAPARDKRSTQRELLLELLRERGSKGLTRLEALHLALSMPARISELRKAGFDIATLREPDSCIGRYVLIREPPGCGRA